MIEYVLEFLKMNDVEYKENIKISLFSPIKIGGIARIVAYPDSALKYIEIIRFLRTIGCRFRIVGRMSNLLPPDEFYDGVIVKTDKIKSVFQRECELYVDAGVTLPELSRLALRCGYSGLEELSGIPGSIGAATLGNAGAFGREISEVVSSLRFYSYEDDKIYNATSDELGFEYRNSIAKQNGWVVLGVLLRLTESSLDKVRARMSEVANIRRQTQPTTLPSLGSTFKRPSRYIFAARLIDECGLKGCRIGGAEVSQKHAGFIVNRGGATARDYIELSDLVSNRVYEKTGVRLQREVELL